MDVWIREVRSDDAEGIVNILNPIIEIGGLTVLDRTFTVVEEREFIANFPKRGIFHVAINNKDGSIVGFQSIEPFATFTCAFDHVGVIGTFVDLSARRQRIGARLSETSFDAAGHRGYEKLFTYVRADNTASLKFHRNLGFRVIGTARRQAKFGREYVDEILIEKFL